MGFRLFFCCKVPPQPTPSQGLLESCVDLANDHVAALLTTYPVIFQRYTVLGTARWSVEAMTDRLRKPGDGPFFRGGYLANKRLHKACRNSIRILR